MQTFLLNGFLHISALFGVTFWMPNRKKSLSISMQECLSHLIVQKSSQEGPKMMLWASRSAAAAVSHEGTGPKKVPKWRFGRPDRPPQPFRMGGPGILRAFFERTKLSGPPMELSRRCKAPSWTFYVAISVIFKLSWMENLSKSNQKSIPQVAGKPTSSSSHIFDKIL